MSISGEAASVAACAFWNHGRLLARSMRSNCEIAVGGGERGRGERERRFAAADIAASGRVIGRDVVVADRPADAAGEGARDEVDGIERHAAAAPQIGGSAQAARGGDAHVVVASGIDDLGERKVLRRARPVEAGFEHQRRTAAPRELHRQRQAGGTGADDDRLVRVRFGAVEAGADHSAASFSAGTSSA